MNLEKINMADLLQFNPDTYEWKTYQVGSLSITCKVFLNITYCTNPKDPIQKMNIFATEKAIAEHAPIFLPNSVGGYMPGPAEEPDRILIYSSRIHFSRHWNTVMLSYPSAYAAGPARI